MRDGGLLRGFKALVRGVMALELGVRRAVSRVRGRPRWALGGTCGGCARCCEAPTLRTGLLVARLPTLRRLFLAWQRHINGWESVAVDRPRRLFTFRCTHFDPATRRCDSYDSRPTACRDYPRALLAQPWPELFEGCGFRVVDADREARLAKLRESGLSPEALAETARRLRLE